MVIASLSSSSDGGNASRRMVVSSLSSSADGTCPGVLTLLREGWVVLCSSSDATVVNMMLDGASVVGASVM